VGAQSVNGVAFVPGSGANANEILPPTTETPTEPGSIIPSQYLGQWATFPDEEGIISYCTPNTDGSFEIFGDTYYVVHSQPSSLLLAKQPDAQAYEATRQLIFHGNAFGIPAIELQRLYPDDDKEPKTLDYFWRSADLEQLEAVTLTDDNWQQYINHSLSDRYHTVDAMVNDNGTATYFYFHLFVLDGSWAEGTVIRNSYLHRSYMIGMQGFTENIPGNTYPTDLRIRLDNRSAEIRVSNIPDGISNGRAIEAQYQGKTNTYYEQFSTPADIQNVTGTVYIPKGFDIAAWMSVND